MNDLVAVEPASSALAPIRFFDLGPKAMIARASEIATVLADVVEKQGLSVRISGGSKPYVKHEGWATLGSLLGILPREKAVTEHSNGTFEAVVELYSLWDGRIVGQGSAICGKDEKRWGNADRYARRSMAITRATGKAYRLGFAWIMTLAGYEATPAEEMPDDGIPFSPASEARAAKAAKPVKHVGRPKEPTIEIYTGTSPDEQWAAEWLAPMKVGEQHWPEIYKRMHGRPKTTDELSVVARTLRTELLGADA